MYKILKWVYKLFSDLFTFKCFYFKVLNYDSSTSFFQKKLSERKQRNEKKNF